MAKRVFTSFWIPLAFGVAFWLIPLAVSQSPVQAPTWLKPVALTLGILCIFAAGAMAYLSRPPALHAGGRGGRASAVGDAVTATGGRGGDAGVGAGGDGGAATARGRGSSAKGGDGGAG